MSLTWDGAATGTTFAVRRQLTDAAGNTGAWVDIPFAGRKPFIDLTVPAGTRETGYQVRANRGGKLSGWSEKTSLLYVSDGGAAVSLRIAA